MESSKVSIEAGTVLPATTVTYYPPAYHPVEEETDPTQEAPPTWPELPERIYGAAGVVEVHRSSETFERGFLGTYQLGERQIRIASGIRPEVAYLTLYHEIVEMALSDSGLSQILDSTKKLKRIKEAVCDAVALAMLAQLKQDLGL